MIEWFAWFALSKCFNVRGRFSAAVSTSYVSTGAMSMDGYDLPSAVKKEGSLNDGRLNISGGCGGKITELRGIRRSSELWCYEAVLAVVHLKLGSVPDFNHKQTMDR
jgi:hypothetical protein